MHQHYTLWRAKPLNVVMDISEHKEIYLKDQCVRFSANSGGTVADCNPFVSPWQFYMADSVDKEDRWHL